MPREILEERFVVRSYHLDEHGEVSVCAVLGYLQESAGLHATELGASMDRLREDRLAWVLNRTKVRLLQPLPTAGEIRVRTWPSAFERVVAQRDFELYDAGDRLLAAATSLWVVVDLDRRRVVRMPAFILALRTFPPSGHIERTSGNLSPPHTGGFERELDVRRADLDIVGHVNNVRLAELVLEAVPPDFAHAHRLVELELHFRAEVRFGDRLRAVAAVTGDGVFAHRLFRTVDDSPVLDAVSRWQRRVALVPDPLGQSS